MVSEFIFNLTRFNPHATKLWNLNIFNLKDQFDLTSNLISNRFNIMKFHDVIIKIFYTIEIISNSANFFPKSQSSSDRPKRTRANGYQKFTGGNFWSIGVVSGRFGSFESHTLWY